MGKIASMQPEHTISSNGRHDHGHTHDHDHDHGHGHSHLPAGSDWRPLAAVLVLTLAFAIVEAGAGFWANSLTLISDAGHQLTDVGAVGLALFALWFSRRAAPRGLTFGYLRFEILAALINGITLLGITGYIFFEAWRRIHGTPEVQAGAMLWVGAAGLVINLACLKVLHQGGGHSLNERGAILHLIGDVLGSLGAVIAGVVIHYTGWTLIDPIVSALIGLLILRSTWELLRETVNILMEGTPIHLSFQEVREAMLAVPGVADVKDLHVWCLASGFDALSAHVVVPDVGQSDAVRGELKALLHQRFHIEHSTLEVERPGDTPECPPGMEGRCDAWRRDRRIQHRH
jgi:cobalt-zinc-cadmium efflux system protein